MSHILIATDFSESGNNAAHYGCQFAIAYGFEARILHTYMVPIAFVDTPMPMVPIQDAQEIAEQAMDKFVAELRARYPSISIQQELLYGDIEDCVNESVEKDPPALVIIGSGSEDGSDLWLSGYAADLMHDLTCIVLAVPSAVPFSRLNNICLTCDFKDLKEAQAITELLELLKITGAKLHALHVDKDGDNSSIKFEDTKLPELLNGVNASFHYSTTGGNIDEAIAQFAMSEKMDLLAVIPHHYSFLARLFHKSHTSAMLHFSHLPVVALPEKE